ncbi:ATP-dependent metallopeptidase FtsH/Yme1/Tma family protein [Peribacillus frigoritolerans]|uniref:ATP-dependent metallopeptidase FtsH/Yme1/Tma family protein n=1 Tax=Peribacillus frigoritolerans TaxID=450367 RepID=UPI003306135F
MKQIFRSKTFYLIIFFVTLGIVLVFNNDNEPTELTEEDFFTTLEDGKVTFLELKPQKSVFEISGRLIGYEKDQYFIASVPNSEISLDRINNAAEEHDIEKIEVTPEDVETSGWVTLITTTIPFMIIFILIFVSFLFLFVMKRMKHSK